MLNLALDRAPDPGGAGLLVDGPEKRECEWDECDHHDEHEDPVEDLVSGHFASGAVRVREEEPSP